MLDERVRTTVTGAAASGVHTRIRIEGGIPMVRKQEKCCREVLRTFSSTPLEIEENLTSKTVVNIPDGPVLIKVKIWKQKAKPEGVIWGINKRG